MASKQALEEAGIDALKVDAIIVATSTPDNPFPATATRVQALLGASNAFAFDINAACSGFVYALSIADQFVRAKGSKTIVVIGAERMSSIVNWEDRSTCVLFGDGAGAFVLQAEESESGIYSNHLFSNGEFYDALYVDTKCAEPNKSGHVVMNGREIFKQAVNRIGEAVEAALDFHKINVDQIDWLVPHQANIRILKGICEHFNFSFDKVILTVDKHANTSAASIPLAFKDGVKTGRIKKDQWVLFESFGAGLTWGSNLIRY